MFKTLTWGYLYSERPTSSEGSKSEINKWLDLRIEFGVQWRPKTPLAVTLIETSSVEWCPKKKKNKYVASVKSRTLTMHKFSQNAPPLDYPQPKNTSISIQTSSPPKKSIGNSQIPPDRPTLHSAHAKNIYFYKWIYCQLRARIGCWPTHESSIFIY